MNLSRAWLARLAAIALAVVVGGAPIGLTGRGGYGGGRDSVVELSESPRPKGGRSLRRGSGGIGLFEWIAAAFASTAVIHRDVGESPVACGGRDRLVLKRVLLI
jgi:hypothetical protein